MKKILIALILMSALFLSAQDYNAFLNLRHSSRDANGNLHLRWEAINDFSALDYEVYYSTGNTWQAAAVSNLSSFTKEALVPYSFGQRLRYRLKTYVEFLGQTVSYMQPAYLDSDSFPPSAQALSLIGTDATGDSLMYYHPQLDITNSYTASTQNRLYRSFQTLGGGFPTSEGFTTYNLYISMLANPSSVTDSLVYAMVYCTNILGLVSPGLYKLGLEGQTPDFSRIGDIQSQVSGGVLHMSCAWDDLTSEPGFGDWPNELNSLLFTDLTIRLTIDLSSFEPEFKIADTGAGGIILFEDNIYEVAQNTLPQLEELEAEPATGRYRLLYTDAENDFPLSACISVPNAQGEYTETEIEPQYLWDGSIIFEEYLPLGSLVKVSDNLIDYSIFEGPSSNENAAAPPLSLSCRIYAADEIKLFFKGLQPALLEAAVYNLKGQKLFDLAALKPLQGELEYKLPASQQARLSSGIYFVKYSQNSQADISRFVYIK